MSFQAAQHINFSPVEFIGRASIGPLSESEEDDKWKTDGVHNVMFERDCTELDLSLIEENWPLLCAPGVITTLTILTPTGFVCSYGNLKHAALQRFEYPQYMSKNKQSGANVKL